MSQMRYITLSKRRALGSLFSCSVTGVHFCSGRTRLPNSGLNTFTRHRFGRQSLLSWVSLGTPTETSKIGGCCRGSKTGRKKSWISWIYDQSPGRPGCREHSAAIFVTPGAVLGSSAAGSHQDEAGGTAPTEPFSIGIEN